MCWVPVRDTVKHTFVLPIMDEESLEAAIQTYNAQLQQVELALGAGLDPSQQSDLIQLQEDLKQLIELTSGYTARY